MTSQTAAQMLKQVIRRQITETYSDPVSNVLGIPFSADTGFAAYIWKQLEKKACDNLGIAYQDYVEATEDKKS